MSGQPTRGGFASRVPTPWRAWARFVRRPVLPDRANLAPAPALKAVFALFGLDLALMGLLLGALSLALALGFQMPEHVLGELKPTPILVAFIVLGAPIGEEIIFRNWLSGRPGHICASLLTAAAVWLLAEASRPPGGANNPTLSIGAFAAIVLVPVLVFALRKRPVLAFFQRRFAVFYWVSVLAFAGIHVTNFAAAGMTALPLVLPQFMLAMILGYLRVNHGLWSSVLTHMLHNALFMAFVLAGAG